MQTPVPGFDPGVVPGPQQAITALLARISKQVYVTEHL
jgi:hypothetical protein